MSHPTSTRLRMPTQAPPVDRDGFRPASTAGTGVEPAGLIDWLPSILGPSGPLPLPLPLPVPLPLPPPPPIPGLSNLLSGIF